MPVEGLQTVLKTLGTAQKETNLKIDEGLEKCAHVILKKALYYCPIEFGPLRESGHVETKGKGKGARSRVVFDAPYAVYVHEILTAYHEPPTCAKFLERAVRETRGTCKSIMKRELEVGRTVKY